MDLIESGKVINITYVQLDVRRKTGGKIKSIEAVITKSKSVREATKVEGVIATQNHYSNFTRNLYQCMEGEQTASVKKIHCHLLLEINGMKVML